MAKREILLLGNPVLRKKCAAIKKNEIAGCASAVADLHDTLSDFRLRNGFGRGIAAPQIGVAKQLIYIDFEYTGPLFNPRIVKRSKKKFQLWDDCFSFPGLLVKVERNYAIAVEFLTEHGKKSTLEAEGALSELLQHEIDHVNGILAVDRAIDSRHIILRSEYDKLKSGSAQTM